VPAIDPASGYPILGIEPYVETLKEVYPLPEAVVLAFGPIAIAKFAGQAAESGLVPYLSSMAFISLQLAIFNLLPLPVLDGGLILLFLIELIRRRPLPEKFKEYWQKVGFALIISLMFFVVINDILRFFRK